MDKQIGGMEASVNPNWCDGHPTQCKDTYQVYQDGGKNDIYYKKYKKYKRKLKALKNI